MVTAGVEGGSKRRIEDELTLIDYDELREFWADVPPMPFTLLAIASALGLDLSAKPEPEYGALEPGDGKSIAEIAAKIKPPIGGDTLSASREVWRMLSEPEGSA